MEELTGFIENYGFPCVGARDGFHVYLNSKLKNNFSFKKRYSRTNLGLVSCNKRFLCVGVSTPGSERVFFAAIFVCVGWNSGEMLRFIYGHLISMHGYPILEIKVAEVWRICILINISRLF